MKSKLLFAIPASVLLLASTGMAHDYGHKTKTHTTSSTGTGTSESWPARVHQLRIEKGMRVELNGSLASGETIAAFDLPGVCLGEANKEAFKGKHVLYGFELPAKTDVKISAIPKDNGKPVALYAYMMPTGRFDLPSRSAALETGAACKTSLAAKSEVGKDVRGLERTIRFDKRDERKNVVVGVVAPYDVQPGDFTIMIETTRD